MLFNLVQREMACFEWGIPHIEGNPSILLFSGQSTHGPQLPIIREIHNPDGLVTLSAGSLQMLIPGIYQTRRAIVGKDIIFTGEIDVYDIDITTSVGVICLQIARKKWRSVYFPPKILINASKQEGDVAVLITAKSSHTFIATEFIDDNHEANKSLLGLLQANPFLWILPTMNEYTDILIREEEEDRYEFWCILHN